MKPIGVIIFVAGAATGGLSAYFVLKKKFDADLKEEIEDVKRVYSKEKLNEHVEVKDDTYSDGTTLKVDSNINITTSPYISSITCIPTTLYTPKPIEEEDIKEAEKLGMLNPGEDPDFPYLISEDTYVDTKENYSKDVLHYYAGDQVIADEDLEAIIHPEMLVGDKVSEYFDNLLEMEHYADAIYIRNDQISRDFEILYHEDSFFC